MTTPRSQDVPLAPQSEFAECLQAKHLREMLLIQCEELDAALANYGSALERYQHRGELTQARRIRGLIRSAKRERRSAHQLIAKLEERFLASEARRAAPRPPGAVGSTVRPAARVHPYPTPHRVIRA